jgi:hypothetical protein
MMPEPETTAAERATSRPFPWFCPKCRRKEVTLAVIPYHAEWLHEGKVIAADIPQLSVPRCANCGELVFNYIAEEQIIKAVEEKARASGPSADGTARAPNGAAPRPSGEPVAEVEKDA